MITKLREIHGASVVLLLGLMLSLMLSCGEVDDDEALYELIVELAWSNAVDMDLYVVEPTGDWVWLTNNGPTATSLGDNNCGFGTACNPASCQELSCNTREGVYARMVTTGRYMIGVNSSSSDDEEVTMFITIPSSWVLPGQVYYLKMACTIPAGNISHIAFAEFPVRGQGTLSGAIAEVTCAVTDARTR